jgi:hypothetical protein
MATIIPEVIITLDPKGIDFRDSEAVKTLILKLKGEKGKPKSSSKTAEKEAGIVITAGEISTILTQETKEERDKRIALTKEKKEELLLVLRFPEIPLHNNPAELALREPVVKRKISNGTRSEDGKAAGENLMSVRDTCRKQGVGFFDYIKDIFSGKRAMTRLAHLISPNASLKPTFY